MAEELTLKIDKEPTFWNKEAAIGLLSGLGPVGMIIGGFIGKNRMETEQKAGKVVTSEPNFWNKETLLGGLLGDLVGAGLAAASFFAVTGASILTLGAGSAAAPAVIGLGATVALAAWAASVTAGAYLGGKAGEERQKKEFEEAKREQVIGHVKDATGSPEIAEAVAHAMEHKKDWAKTSLENKLLSVKGR